MSKHPIRCILLIFFEIVKIPREVEVMKIIIEIIFPSKVGSENIKITRISIDNMINESLL